MLKSLPDQFLDDTILFNTQVDIREYVIYLYCIYICDIDKIEFETRI